MYVELSGDKTTLPACEILAGLPPSILLYNQHHVLRHPLGIYNVSSATCLQRMRVALNLVTSPELAVEIFSQNFVGESSLLDAYDSFLDSMMEHMEDCLSVLLCFFTSSRDRDKHPAVKAYKNSVDSYRNHIGALVNHIKHEHGRIRLTAITNIDHFVAGYFVEGLNEHGALGPSTKVHRDGNNAYSFHRDLRLHLVNLILVSECLAIAIGEIVGGRAVLPSQSSQVVFKELIVDISNLPKSVFRNEERLDLPRVSFNPNGGTVSLIKIEFPCAYERVVKLKGQCRTTTRFAGDGATKSFQFPF